MQSRSTDFRSVLASHRRTFLAAGCAAGIAIFVTPASTAATARRSKISDGCVVEAGATRSASGIDPELMGRLGYGNPANAAVETRSTLGTQLEQLKRERDSLAEFRNSAHQPNDSTGDSLVEQRAALRQQLRELQNELSNRPRPPE